MASAMTPCLDQHKGLVMSKFTSSVPPASSLEEARDLAFDDHRARIESVAMPVGFSNVNWQGKSLISYVYRVGETAGGLSASPCRSALLEAGLQNGEIMDTLYRRN
jgi:hypothetical protein